MSSSPWLEAVTNGLSTTTCSPWAIARGGKVEVGDGRGSQDHQVKIRGQREHGLGGWDNPGFRVAGSAAAARSGSAVTITSREKEGSASISGA
jgi:hypothetical protein